MQKISESDILFAFLDEDQIFVFKSSPSLRREAKLQLVELLPLIIKNSNRLNLLVRCGVRKTVDVL